MMDAIFHDKCHNLGLLLKLLPVCYNRYRLIGSTESVVIGSLLVG